MDRRPEPGEIFKLKPSARIEWLAAITYRDHGLKAVRCDSEIGQMLLKWIADGSDFNNRPCRAWEIEKDATEFWHDWSGFTLVRDAREAK